MKNFIVIAFSLWSGIVSAQQWTTANGIISGRNDDIFFVDDSVGYVAGGNRKEISKTTDGGNTWTDIFSTSGYLRSIEFIDASTGFCGSLDSGLYMTSDSGATWQNIAASISPRPRGICGLSIPDDSTIYGCGFYNEPAFVIKSTDRGQSWTYIDMSVFAKALVEVHFINKDTGFVAGRANPFTDGGIILKTTDGGLTWNPVALTLTNLDYVWKIQSPDGKNYYGAVSSTPGAGNTTFLKSVDYGQSWVKQVVDTAWYDIQMIGFIDSLKGWTGGGNELFETFDGGVTWNKTSTTIPGGRFYNRFIKQNDSTAFISGLRIYKYGSPVITGIEQSTKIDEIHFIKITPNPTSQLNARIAIGDATSVSIKLIDINGKLVEELFHGRLEEGTYNFTSDQKHENEILFLVMRTNEGLYSEKVVFK